MRWFGIVLGVTLACAVSHAGEADPAGDLKALVATLGRKVDALAQSNARLEADLALLKRDYVETYSIRYGGTSAGLGAYVDAYCARKGKDVHVRGVETISVNGVDVTSFECRTIMPAR